MLYKAKVAVCSDISTKHITQNERHVEFLNAKPFRNKKKAYLKAKIEDLETNSKI